MSHFLLNTPYDETPYILLSLCEEEMINNAKKIANGEIDAVSLLTKNCAIMGLGTIFTGTTHLGSMSEHAISHYIDMFAKEKHPGTSHGEQVGIATMSVSKIQNEILLKNSPPIFFPTKIPEDEIKFKLGTEILENIKYQMKFKLYHEKKADELVKARAATQRIMNAEKTAARKLDTRKKVIWGAALKAGAKNDAQIAQLMRKLYNEGYVAEKDKHAVRADYDALTASNNLSF